MDKNNPVTKYLVHSYIYYILFDSYITDGEYDTLCRDMLNNFDSLDSPYIHLVEKEALRAGTGYQIKASDYPEEIVAYAKSLVS